LIPCSQPAAEPPIVGQGELGGTVVATYHSCPTGNPYRHFGLLLDPNTQTYTDGFLRIDPDSGNASQPQFCLLPGFLVGVFCPRTSPATTAQQAQTQPPCAASAEESEADLPGEVVGPHGEEGSIHGLVRRPEHNDTGQCHVNLEVVGDFGAYLNFHIGYRPKGQVYFDVLTGQNISSNAVGVADTFVPELAAYYSGRSSTHSPNEVEEFFYNNTLAYLEVLRLAYGG
jgi:hypothetical protein